MKEELKARVLLSDYTRDIFEGIKKYFYKLGGKKKAYRDTLKLIDKLKEPEFIKEYLKNKIFVEYHLYGKLN
ncbi:MAG: hypothetical protein B6D55_04700 [Candidatus Omnitrophica bacterium 4484_70.2]|nr:MAG: hypothetical protein B6D55_04700 [Candidatus Omnitrophica bacterium 4484_70.2]